MNKATTKFNRRKILEAVAGIGALTLVRSMAHATGKSITEWQLMSIHQPDNARIAIASCSPLTMAMPAGETSVADVKNSDAIFILVDNKAEPNPPLPDEIYAAHRDGVITAQIGAAPAVSSIVMSDIARLYCSDETMFRCNDLGDMRLILNSTCGNEIPTIVATVGTSSGANAVSHALCDAMGQLETQYGVELKSVERVFIIVAGKRGSLRLDNVYRDYRFLMSRFARDAWLLYGAIYDEAMDADIRTTLMIGA